MKISQSIIINLQFEAIHNWKECDIEGVMFLKYPHRHMFHVKLTIPVTHENRDIEFIDLKREIENHCREELSKEIEKHGWSCEKIGEVLGLKYNASEVVVLEDGENGSRTTLEAE